MLRLILRRIKMADKVRPIDANALRLMNVAECAGHTIEYAWVAVLTEKTASGDPITKV
jgi:hypothetical protein